MGEFRSKKADFFFTKVMQDTIEKIRFNTKYKRHKIREVT
jgi:hypothetical protein